MSISRLRIHSLVFIFLPSLQLPKNPRTMTSTVQPVKSLLALPPEVRVAIYNHLSHDSEIRWNHKPGRCGHTVPRCSHCSKRRCDCFPYPKFDTSHYHVNLAATCKLLRSEFLDVLLTNTHVHVCCAVVLFHPNGMRRAMSGVLGAVRTVSIGSSILEDFPAGTFPSLETLHVTHVDMPVRFSRSMDEMELVLDAEILDMVAHTHGLGGKRFCSLLQRYRAQQPLRVFLQLCYKPSMHIEDQTTMVVSSLLWQEKRLGC